MGQDVIIAHAGPSGFAQQVHRRLPGHFPATNFVAVSLKPDAPRSIRLTWKDNTEGEAGYLLYRSVDDGPWIFTVLLPADTETYDHELLDHDTSYKYRLRPFLAPLPPVAWAFSNSVTTPDIPLIVDVEVDNAEFVLLVTFDHTMIGSTAADSSLWSGCTFSGNLKEYNGDGAGTIVFGSSLLTMPWVRGDAPGGCISHPTVVFDGGDGEIRSTDGVEVPSIATGVPLVHY